MEIQSILCTSTKLRKVNVCQFLYVLMSRFLFSSSHQESYGNISSVILAQCKLKLKIVFLSRYLHCWSCRKSVQVGKDERHACLCLDIL